MNNVIVPLNAFAPDDVQNNGQAAFLQTIAEAGAYGAEIRRELLQTPADMVSIQVELEKHKLFAVYSAPIFLWNEDGSLNSEGLAECLSEAESLGAGILKLALGHFRSSENGFSELAAVLSQYPGISLLIENDQTDFGGRIEPQKLFFESVRDHHIPVGMTFDTGNWLFTGEDPGEAMDALKPYIRYLHFKHVENRSGECVTLPLAADQKEGWKRISARFPADQLKALEFPLTSKKDIAFYINVVGDCHSEAESGVDISVFEY